MQSELSTVLQELFLGTPSSPFCCRFCLHVVCVQADGACSVKAAPRLSQLSREERTVAMLDR